MELGRRSKKHVEDHMTWVVKILAESEVMEICILGTLRIPSFILQKGLWAVSWSVASSNASSSVLLKVFPLISSFFWCHMYDVLVYKMLWDRKKILNINLWRIIRLSMRPATSLCPHISLERILVYTVLV